MSTHQTLNQEWWGIDQFFKLRWQQPTLLRSVLDWLMQENEELRWTMVVNAYQDHQINLGKAAELLDMHELELRERFINMGIPLRLGPADLSAAQAEAAAIRAWYATDRKKQVYDAQIT